MFQVFRNKRVLSNKTIYNPNTSGNQFFTYEGARQALRKYIRKQVNAGKKSRYDFGYFDQTSRNPSAYGIAGYRILKVS